MKCILIICRTLDEASFIGSMDFQQENTYVLASDDVRVHALVSKYPWIRKACYIEQAESLYAVATTVKDLNQRISQWLTSLVEPRDAVPPHMLAWPCVVEGGMTTQRIQDVLLLVNSYMYLLQSRPVSEIVLHANGNSAWEDDVLIETARSAGIPVRIVGALGVARIRRRIKAVLRTVGRQPYYIARLVLTKIKRGRGAAGVRDAKEEVAFQLCGSNDRHVENILAIMGALRTKGYEVLALCWQAAAGGMRIQREGFPVVTLEGYVSLISIGAAIAFALKIFVRARRSYWKLFLRRECRYKAVPLARLLWPSVVHFIVAEVPQRYMLSVALQGYFRFHSPLAMKLWAGGAVYESSSIVEMFRNNDRRPRFVSWVLGIIGDDPYETKYEGIDLFLASGNRHAAYLRRMGFPDERIVSVGMSRYDHLRDFKREYCPSRSRRHLGIPETYSFYILLDANAVMRGYISQQEQIDNLDALLGFAKDHPEVAVLIKPHPNHRHGFLDYLIDSYRLENVFTIAKDSLPYHAINAADVVITKFSTIGLEAMLFERPRHLTSI